MKLHFFKALFKKKNMGDIQIIDIAGRDKLKNNFVTLKNTPNFKNNHFSGNHPRC